MSGYIPSRLAREIRARSGDACEYCLLAQDSQEATFHIDHVIPRDQGGKTSSSNLALACVSCSLRKAARHRVRDPRSGKVVALFNPRVDTWAEDFTITKACRINGRTPTGRATVESLAMNRGAVVAIRKVLTELRHYPSAGV